VILTFVPPLDLSQIRVHSIPTLSLVLFSPLLRDTSKLCTQSLLTRYSCELGEACPLMTIPMSSAIRPNTASRARWDR
jgi:hypothetical protein